MSTVATNQVWNVPNVLSMIRLSLAILVGLLIEWRYLAMGAVIFIIAASTDFVDGWWARRYGQVTKLGRVLDPFVDKIIVTAALVALVSLPGSGWAAWMVTVIVGRELLVTTIRAMVEGQGGDFSAQKLGKWKMLLQCAAIVSSMLSLHSEANDSWLVQVNNILIWLAIVLTILSGIDYVVKAIRLSQQPEL